MHRQPKFLAAAIGSLCVAAPSVQGADVAPAAPGARIIAAPVVQIRGILPDRLEAVPGAFDVVDRRQLETRRPFSVKEALNQVSGVNVVDEDSAGLALNIGIRGLDPRRTQRTLLLEDGMPLFLAPYSDPSAHFSTPLERVERIEVVKGSGQILHGPQTIGGMINFITRPIPREGFKGSAQGAVGNQGYRNAHLNIGYGNERYGFMVDALERQGDGVRRGHDFEVREYTAKGRLRLTDTQEILAKIGTFEENSRITETGLGTLEYAEDKYQARAAGLERFDQKRDTIQLQHLWTLSGKARLSTELYHVDQSRASFRQIDAPGGYGDDPSERGASTGYSVLDRCDPGDPRPGGGVFGGGAAGSQISVTDSMACGGRWRPRKFRYYGIEPRLDISHDLFGIRSDAVIGFRYHAEDVNRKQVRSDDPAYQSLSFALNDALGAEREHIQIDTRAMSYYAQNTFHVGDWSITPGVRVEDVKIRTDIIRADGAGQNNPESYLSNRQVVVLPGFGVAWNGITDTTIFAGVHAGFAPPRPDRDITANGTDSAVVTRVKPERSTNWELGIRSGYYKGVKLASTLFYTDFDDIVISTAAGTFRNGGKSQQGGLELAGRIDFGTIFPSPDNVYLSGSYTNLMIARFGTTSDAAFNTVATNGNGIIEGTRLPYAPRHMLSLNLGYEHPVGLDARIGIDYRSAQQPDAFARVLEPVDAALSGLAGEIPSVTLVNAAVNFRPKGSQVSYFISGHNLTNREYLASRVNGMTAGRQRLVFAGVRIDF